MRDLGLTGLKLYPMYQDWSPADPVTAFPVFEKAQELGIPVMVHQAGSTRIDARMEHARPALLDAAGRTSGICGSRSRTAGCPGWTRPCSC